MRIGPALVLVSVLLGARSARADDYDQAAKDVARRYAEEGIAFHDKGDYPAAVVSFGRAYRVLGAPTIGIRLGRSLVKLGRLIEGKRAYEAVIATPLKQGDPPVFAEAVTDARAELVDLSPRIPTLELAIETGVTSPTLDGSPVPPAALGRALPIDPGTHRASGLGAMPEALVVHERDRLKLMLRSAPEAPLPPPEQGLGWRRIVGFSSAGLGVVSLTVGIIGSLRVHAAGSDPAYQQYASTVVTSDVCASSSAGGDHPDAKVASLCVKGGTGEALEAVFYTAAVVFGVAGAVLIVTGGQRSSPSPAQVHLVPHAGPGTAGLDVIGSF